MVANVLLTGIIKIIVFNDKFLSKKIIFRNYIYLTLKYNRDLYISESVG
jgi:hypothetical protein